MNVSTTRIGRFRSVFALLCAGVALLVVSVRADATLTLRDLTRLEGHGESTLRGLGFVMGLPGTGDSGTTPPLARQLAKLLEVSGNPIAGIEELVATRNIAMVMVTCTIPKEGARRGDKFDCYIQAWHNAKSLEGGRLFITPLLGPRPGQGVYAFAEGDVILDGQTLTSGRARLAARVSEDIVHHTIAPTGTVTLVIEPQYAGWGTARLIADLINSDRQGLDTTLIEIARAVSEREVVVAVPEPELDDPSGFVANVQDIPMDPSLLPLPAKVIVNERRGTIVVTGNVSISPAVISHRDLVITTVTPPREPTPDRPRVVQSSWTDVQTTVNDRDRTRLLDLLEALRQLSVPVRDQMAILKELHRLGHLHAEFVEE